MGAGTESLIESLMIAIYLYPYKFNISLLMAKNLRQKNARFSLSTKVASFLVGGGWRDTVTPFHFSQYKQGRQSIDLEKILNIFYENQMIILCKKV
jgi:hypothetical protein